MMRQRRYCVDAHFDLRNLKFGSTQNARVRCIILYVRAIGENVLTQIFCTMWKWGNSTLYGVKALRFLWLLF